MRRKLLALAAITGTAAVMLAAAPASADATEAPAPDFEDALASIDGQRLDLVEAVAAPLGATATMGGGSLARNDLPVGYCGGAWTWDVADLGDWGIDLTYGFSADCNFPPVGYPEPHLGTEAQLHGLDGGPGAFAPSGDGGLGFPAESIETVERTWPSAWSMSAQMSITLFYEDPSKPWVWVDVPPECAGAGTNILYCEYQTEPLYFGNTPCGESNTFSEPAGEMHAGLTCYDDSGTVTGRVTDNRTDGLCTYALAQTSDGEFLWEGVCDGGGTESFNWPTESTIVHTWLHFE